VKLCAKFIQNAFLEWIAWISLLLALHNFRSFAAIILVKLCAKFIQNAFLAWIAFNLLFALRGLFNLHNFRSFAAIILVKLCAKFIQNAFLAWIAWISLLLAFGSFATVIALKLRTKLVQQARLVTTISSTSAGRRNCRSRSWFGISAGNPSSSQKQKSSVHVTTPP
jgi:hypothetical protein